MVPRSGDQGAVQGWDWSGTGEVPKGQHLRRPWEFHFIQCLLKFCIQGTSHASYSKPWRDLKHMKRCTTSLKIKANENYPRYNFSLIRLAKIQMLDNTLPSDIAGPRVSCFNHSGEQLATHWALKSQIHMDSWLTSKTLSYRYRQT